MSKSLAERYAQILSEDPTSTVFVELAKALLAQGEWEQAIEVCRQGLEHHPQSVIARVLWGRALIQLGKPAPAMEQFDLAVNIDRDNPHAYNLISEVLLQKGLYRSALPILRKAVALQPHDARVQGWLEQTRQALEGGPAPAFEATDALAPKDPDALEEEGDDDAQTPGAQDAADDAGDDADAAGLATEKVPTLGSEPITDGAAPASDIPQLFPVDDAPTKPDVHEAATPAAGSAPVGKARKSGVLSAAWEVGPMDVPGRAASDASSAGEDAGTDAGPFDGEEKTVVDPGAGGVAASGGLLDELPDAASTDAAAATGEAPEGDAEEATGDAGTGGGLLGDLPPLEPPAAAASADDAERPGAEHIPASVGSTGVLLGDLPLPEPAADTGAAKGAAKVRLKVGADNAKRRDAIASDYEKELRGKLAEQRAQRRARRQKIIVAAVALVLLLGAGAGAWSFISVRDDFGGKDLKGALADARRDLGADTHAGLQRSLTSLDTATRMDETSTEAWALTAFAHALLAAEHGGGDPAKTAARAALDRPGVRDAHPSTGLVVDWLLKEGRERELAGETVLASAVGRDPELHALAGRILLAKGSSEAALERFQLALEVQPTHGRTLLALGAYFREAGDFDQALAMYERVEANHPEKILGQVEIGLRTDALPEDALASLEALPEQELRTPELRSRAHLAAAQVLSLEGRHEEALARVAEAQQLEVAPLKTLLVQSAVERAAGKTAKAQVSAEAAVKLDETSDAAREALGRALLARGKPRELLEALPADADNRTISLMRGLARARLEEWRSARTEFLRTALEGRFPPEAVVGLAMVDANGGRPEKAQESLERLLVSDGKVPDSIRVALGQVYWQRGLLDKAKAQFEDAAGRPRDAEGNLQLGRLLLEQDRYEDAIAPLKIALDRNAGSEQARAAYTQALLGLGQTEKAEAQLKAWLEADDESAQAHYWSARAALLQGDGKRAAVEALKASRLERSWAEAVRVQSIAQSMAGSGSAAFKTLQRANKMDSKDPETFCEIGWTFLRQGNAKNAEAAFEAALKNDSLAVCARAGQVELNPRGYRTQTADIERLAKAAGSVWTQAQWQIALSQVHLVNRKSDDALASAENAAALVPGSARAHAAIARAATAARKNDQAVAAWAKAVSLDPDNGAFLLEQAQLLQRDRETLGDAVKAYRAYLRLPGDDGDQKRVRKLLPRLEKRVASR